MHQGEDIGGGMKRYSTHPFVQHFAAVVIVSANVHERVLQDKQLKIRISVYL
jgi:hypothetical protein